MYDLLGTDRPEPIQIRAKMDFKTPQQRESQVRGLACTPTYNLAFTSPRIRRSDQLWIEGQVLDSLEEEVLGLGLEIVLELTIGEWGTIPAQMSQKWIIVANAFRKWTTTIGSWQDCLPRETQTIQLLLLNKLTPIRCLIGSTGEPPPIIEVIRGIENLHCQHRLPKLQALDLLKIGQICRVIMSESTVLNHVLAKKTKIRRQKWLAFAIRIRQLQALKWILKMRQRTAVQC